MPAVSAEVRWFWKALPPELDAFFGGGPFPPGGGKPRRDDYLVDPNQTELGLKKRGGTDGVEIKGLVATRGRSPAPFAGQIQIWSKWASQALTIDHLPHVMVHKTRWLRKFDTSRDAVAEIPLDPDERPRDSPHWMPERGCHFELVALRVDDIESWSVGFEAFGSLETVEDSLVRTLQMLAAGAPPATVTGLELSYPAWLAQLPTIRKP